MHADLKKSFTAEDAEENRTPDADFRGYAQISKRKEHRAKGFRSKKYLTKMHCCPSRLSALAVKYIIRLFCVNPVRAGWSFSNGVNLRPNALNYVLDFLRVLGVLAVK
jgi:hypothetical protein